MPRITRLEGLGQLLDQQFAVVSREQLLALGMKDHVMQYRVRAGGPWQGLLPGVYLGVTGGPNLLQKEMAALLFAGPASLITGPTALLHYGTRSESDPDMIDVLVPIARQRHSTGFVRLHRTTRMPERFASTGPLRFAPVPRAVADTARLLTDRGDIRSVRSVVADAVQQGRCTVSQLAVELSRGPIRRSALFRSVLAEVADGVRSTAEADLRQLTRSARLPMPLFNASLHDGDTFIAKPDGWWPDAGVAAEVDSREWHLRPADWERTMARHDRMAAAGIILLHVPPRQIRSEPAQVVEMIRGALERGRMRPPLPIRATPCSTQPPVSR
jgi:hypothetical protein